MIIVDNALKKREKENNPIRVGLVGAGNVGRGITLQIEKYFVGMKLVAIANRTLANAVRAYTEAEVDAVKKVDTVAQLENFIAEDRYTITNSKCIFPKKSYTQITKEYCYLIEKSPNYSRHPFAAITMSHQIPKIKLLTILF